MEDYRIDLVIGQGAGAGLIRSILNRFTLIGATTRAGLVTAPLRSRLASFIVWSSIRLKNWCNRAPFRVDPGHRRG